MSKVSNDITNIYRTGNNYLLITVPGVPKKLYIELGFFLQKVIIVKLDEEAI